MVYTAEQRRAAAAKGRAAQAAKRSGGAVMEQPDASDESALLAQLGAALIGASKKKGNESKLLTQLEGILSQLDPREHPDLAENETILAFIEKIGERREKAHPEDPPGTVYGAGLGATAKPWTYGHVQFLVNEWRAGRPGIAEVTVIPAETKWVCWNGLAYVFHKRKETTCPDVFWNVYKDSLGLQEYGEQNIAYLFKQEGAQVQPDMVTPEAARVRGTGKGTFYANAGMAGMEARTAVAEGAGT